MIIAISSLIIALLGIILYRWLPGWLAWHTLTTEERAGYLKDAIASSIADGRTGGMVELPTLQGSMIAFITVVVLIAALFVILSGRYDDGTQKWAYAAVSTLLGFWLRGSGGSDKSLSELRHRATSRNKGV